MFHPRRGWIPSRSKRLNADSKEVHSTEETSGSWGTTSLPRASAWPSQGQPPKGSLSKKCLVIIGCKSTFEVSALLSKLVQRVMQVFSLAHVQKARYNNAESAGPTREADRHAGALLPPRKAPQGARPFAASAQAASSCFRGRLMMAGHHPTPHFGQMLFADSPPF